MKISLKWLNEYVNVKDFFAQPQKLADLLTNSGLEVDAVTNLSEQFHHVVVGHVKELGRHPDADKLTVCQVDAGEGSLRQIICGAKNHKAGDKVVVCLPGSVLPGDFKIKESKIRGVDSRGMLASESELGLSKESEGILLLPADAPVGQPFAEYMGLDDILLDISVTPNRADCLSHVGLAREVACLLGRPYEVPAPHFEAKGSSTKSAITLKLQDSVACPRYAGRSVFGVKVGPSPKWLKTRLEAVGLNSINNVVDVTNYVMLEMGQPLHAFDASLLRGKTVLVARADKGESFTTLDGTELKLTGEELTIRDGVGPVALAGVIGGKNSGVSESTQDIFIESAFFSSGGVRHTSRRFGLDTDSSQRFSRGTDPDGVLQALNRACELVQKVAGGHIAQDFYDEYPKPLKHQPIGIALDLVEQRLGYAVDKADFMQWMTRLGCHVHEKEKSVFSIQPPAFRWDLAQDVDLIEEYGRLHGYDKIPEAMPALIESPTADTTEYIHHNRVADLLVREGYLECVNYRFLAEKAQVSFLGDMNKMGVVGLAPVGEVVRLKNPLSEELGVMRSSVLPSLFQNLLHNYRHGKDFGRLFELDFAFGKKGSEYEQKSRLALVAWGQRKSLWSKNSDSRPVVYDLKASVERTLQRLLITSFEWRSLKKEDVPDFLHPKQSAGLFIEGRFVGVLGTLHPQLVASNKIRESVAVAEVDVAQLMRGQPRPVKAKSISKFPSVERDLAVVMTSEVSAGAVMREIQKAGAPFVQSVDVLDVFEGGNLKAGERSVTFRMLCQKMDGTLTDDELKGLQTKVIEALQTKLKLSLR